MTSDILLLTLAAKVMARNGVSLLVVVIVGSVAVSAHNECPMGGNDVIEGNLTREDVEYCLIDNCTIMRIDTSQELGIVNVEDDVLVAVATNNQTFAIMRLPDEEYCEDVLATGYTVEYIVLLVLKFVILLFLAVPSVYIIALHLLKRELQYSSIGKILIVYNALLVVAVLFYILLLSFHTLFHASAPVCQVILYIRIYFLLCFEVSSALVFVHIGHLMYHSHLRNFEIANKWMRRLLAFYALVTFTIMIPMVVYLILLDVFSGSGKEAVLETGHCVLPPGTTYSTLTHLTGYAVPFKVGQLMIFVKILVYSKHIYRSAPNEIEPVDIDNEPRFIHLFQLAVIMMLTILIFSILWVIGNIVGGITSVYLDLFCTLVVAVQQYCIAIGGTIALYSAVNITSMSTSPSRVV